MALIRSGLPPAWSHVGSAYAPTPVDTPAMVLEFDRTKKAGGWADPPDWTAVDFTTRQTHAEGGTLFVDDNGRPLNPAGPTGKSGRLLGKWGPNLAADPVVFRRSADGAFEMLAIERKDTGEWAIPGGMVDDGESPRAAAARELREECGVTVDFDDAHEVFAGVVDADPRNTDHAWMETTVLATIVGEGSQSIVPSAGDDARKAEWVRLDDETLPTLYANHASFVRRALEWAQQQLPR